MRRASIATGLSLVFLLLAVVPSTAYTVRQGHPRLLLTPETIPALRERCRTSHSALFNNLKQQVDQRIGAGRKSAVYIPHYAFVYLMTGDRIYREKTVEAMLECAAHGENTAGEGDGPARISALALGYDWMYNDMTPDERRIIALSMVPTVRDDKPDPGDTHPWLPAGVYMGYALAIYGDGYDDADAADGFARAYRQFTDQFIPALDEVGTFGAADGYAPKRTAYMFVLAEILRSALGEDWASRSMFIRNGGSFWAHRMRSDLALMRTPGKWNMADYDPAVFFSYFASRFPGERDAALRQGLAKAFIDRSWADPSQIAWRTWELILWYDPRQPSALSADTLSYRCTGSGMVFMRDRWDFAPSSPMVVAGFWNGPDLVRARGQNHFTISRGADDLVIDSGAYYSDLDDHYEPYYLLSVAHNSVLIQDPSETIGQYTNYRGKTHRIPDEGEQIRSDEGQGRRRWPHAEGTYGYRGEIRAFRDAGSYVYIMGDATPAYRTKASRVVREFVYVRPDIFVIRDRVTRTDPTFRTKSLIHAVERPEIPANLRVVRGDLATGGIFESESARKAVITRGGSRAEVFFVRPGAGSGVLRVVGGGNERGEPWKQTWEPDEPLTYSSSSSYEFWVDDRNWTPCGQYCGQSQIDGRNAAQPGNEAGDWRIEIEAPPGDRDVFFLTVIRVRPRAGGSETSVRRTETPALETVEIARAPGDTVVVSFARPEGLRVVNR